MTVWEGYIGPLGSDAVPSSDPAWVKAVAGFFAGKAAVATAIGRDLLPVAPRNVEQEHGDFGFLGREDADQARVACIILACTIIVTHIRDMEIRPDFDAGIQATFETSKYAQDLEWLRIRRNRLNAGSLQNGPGASK